MRHILRVLTLISYESPIEHGYFEATDLEEALKCAKAHIDPYDTTIVEAVPFGRRMAPRLDETYIHTNSPLTVWEHNPHKCQETLGGWARANECEVCSKYVQEVREAEERRLREKNGEAA